MKTKSSPSAWIVLAGLIIWPALQFGAQKASIGVLVAIFMVTVAYLLAIYLYYAIAGSIYYGRRTLIAVGAVASIIVGGAVASPNHLWNAMIEPVIIVIAAALAGTLSRGDNRTIAVYIIGVVALIVLIVPVSMSIWPEQMSKTAEAFKAMIRQMETMPELEAQSGPDSENLVLALEKTADMTSRLIPAITIMNAILQFSIGFILFHLRSVTDPQRVSEVLSFARWKVPFGLAPVLIVTILMRLLGGDSLRLIADNGMFILSLFYCVGGLALAEGFMRNIKMPLAFRIMFYLFLTMMGIVGFALTAIIGFIDSFTDWRKIDSVEIELKK